jgi:hypothetical protein
MQRETKIGSDKMIHYVCPTCGKQLDPSEFNGHDQKISEYRYYLGNLHSPVNYETLYNALPTLPPMEQIEDETSERLKNNVWFDIDIRIRMSNPGPRIEDRENERTQPLRTASKINLGSDNRNVHLCTECIVKLLQNKPLTSHDGPVVEESTRGTKSIKLTRS